MLNIRALLDDLCGKELIDANTPSALIFADDKEVTNGMTQVWCETRIASNWHIYSIYSCVNKCRQLYSDIVV